MNPWLQILGSGGLATIAVVVVNALAQRRNLGATTARTDAETGRTDAETAEMFTKTARGLVADIQAKNLELAARVVRLEEKDGEARTLIEELQVSKSSLERRLTAIISDRDDVVAYLVTFREWVALGSPPPPPRVPLHLRNVIPDWMPDDDDRSTDVVVRRGPEDDPAGP